MKQGAGLTLGLVVGALVAGAGGFWLGNKGATPHDGSGTTVAAGAVSPGDTPKKARKLL